MEITFIFDMADERLWSSRGGRALSFTGSHNTSVRLAPNFDAVAKQGGPPRGEPR